MRHGADCQSAENKVEGAPRQGALLVRTCGRGLKRNETKLHDGKTADRHLADRKQRWGRHHDDHWVDRAEERTRAHDGAGECAAGICRARSGRLGRLRHRRPRNSRLAVVPRGLSRGRRDARRQPRGDRPVPRRTGADRGPHPARHHLELRAESCIAGRSRFAPGEDPATDCRAPEGRSAAVHSG